VFYKIKTGKIRDIFLSSLLWIFFEYLRAIGLSVFWAGPGALIGAHWSFGFLGYALAGNKFFLQFAGIGGVYILSFLIVFINGIFCHIFILFKNLPFNRKKFFLITSPLLIIIICLIIFGIKLNDNHYPNSRYFKVAVIHTNFPNFFTITWEDFSKRLLVMADLLKKAKEEKIEPDIIVFPEDSRFLAYYTNPQYNEFFKNVFEGKEKLVIDSARLDDGGNIRSVLYFFNTKSGEKQNYKKMLLMFNGEYLPYIVSFAARLIGQSGWVDDFNNFRSYSKGEEITSGEFDGIKMGALFCSEIVSPELYRSVTKKGAEVLINIASDAAFHNSSLLVKQMLDTAKVRAVENNRYFIQAGNSGPSFIIDNKGRVVMFSDNPGAEILYGEVRVIGDKSVYDSL
jgi:apolipoprotein N-acyltransferase